MTSVNTRLFLIVGLTIAVAIAILLSPFASKSPDGLEKVAQDKGFIKKGEGKPLYNAPIPDYAFARIKNEWLSVAAAGLIGTLFSFGLVMGLGSIIKKRQRNRINNLN
jgi:cobalt/nickel transport protein